MLCCRSISKRQNYDLLLLIWIMLLASKELELIFANPRKWGIIPLVLISYFSISILLSIVADVFRPASAFSVAFSCTTSSFLSGKSLQVICERSTTSVDRSTTAQSPLTFRTLLEPTQSCGACQSALQMGKGERVAWAFSDFSCWYTDPNMSIRETIFIQTRRKSSFLRETQERF